MEHANNAHSEINKIKQLYDFDMMWFVRLRETDGQMSSIQIQKEKEYQLGYEERKIDISFTLIQENKAKFNHQMVKNY